MYVITADFRYRGGEDDWKNDKVFCIDICKTADEAVEKGNKALEYIERRIGNQFREKFSLNGGCFGSRKFLVADMNVKCKGKRMEIFVIHTTQYARSVDGSKKQLKEKRKWIILQKSTAAS